MLIQCPTCEAKVNASVIAEKQFAADDYTDPHKYLFLECPSCNQILLGYSEWELGSPTTEGWSEPFRLWPEPHEYFHVCIPSLVRRSLEDARSVTSEIYTACAVMCGRAIEAICKEKTSEGTYLHKGLKKLKDNGVIDNRIYSWGEALRKERNIGAHASEDTVSKEDAKDIFDFSTAIAEYVYVMAEKFDAYQLRKQKIEKK